MVSPAPACEGTITYTWTYTDCEGNSQDYVHTVTIEYEPIDPIAPTTATAACVSDIVVPTPPTVLDNCGVELTPTGPVVSPAPACEGTITYTWTYTDCEGNSQDYVHTVTIEYEPIDPIAPTTATAACVSDIVVPTPPTVLDNCGVEVTPTGPVVSPAPACEGTITYTWTYTDCEGNSQDYVHTVTIEYEPIDPIAPTTATAACVSDIVVPTPPTVLDNCGVELTPTGPVVSPAPACEGTITYTWTYTDCEGNSQDYVHTVTIEYEPIDPIAPTTATAACVSDIVVPTPPTVLDNCGVELTPTGPVVSPAPACEGTITYTWTYTDCEGNSQDYVHTVTIEYEPIDPIAPTTATAACVSDIVVPTPPTVLDNCGVELTPTGPVVSPAPACEGTITYTWTYTDCEGNSQDYVHTVTIEYEPIDPIAPTTATAACVSDIVVPTPPTVLDNCGVEHPPTGPVVSPAPACEGTITYTWTYTDCEGNSQDYVHTVTIEYEPIDPIAPTTATAACVSDIVVPTPPTVLDNCGVELTPTGPVVSPAPACEGTITYTWTYTDCEGNSQDYVHTVTIEYEPIDPIAPTTATAACVSDIVVPTPPTVLDNCGVELTPTGPVVSPAPACEGTITYTWTYTDCEGNSQDYVIHLQLSANPLIRLPRSTGTAACGPGSSANTASVVDNCGVNVTPTRPVVYTAPACEGTITYTWTYTDCEGNSQDYVIHLQLSANPLIRLPRLRYRCFRPWQFSLHRLGC